MHWILQENIFNERAYDELLSCLERFDISHSVHKVVPFVGDLLPEPQITDTKVICMGSYSMRHYADEKGWTPGVFDLEPYDFTVQKFHWGALMLNADSQVCTFELAKFPQGSELLFIRPIQDSKVFAGGMFERAEFEDWQTKVCVLEEDFGNSLTKNTLIQLATPKKIYAEYRCWVVGDQVVTASLYKRGDRVFYQNIDDDVNHPAKEYAEECLRVWRPPVDALVIDVADTADGWKIVEINTINSCGFYASNIPRLVHSLEQMVSESG